MTRQVSDEKKCCDEVEPFKSFMERPRSWHKQPISAVSNFELPVIASAGMSEATAAIAVPQAPSTQDERTMATLAHALQLVGGWIAPLVIFLMRRSSRFVSFHALQVLLLRGIYVLILMVVMVIAAGLVIFGVAITAASGHNSSVLPVFFFLFFPIFWMSWFLMWMVTLVTAILYGVKAGRGEWVEYPLVGRWARQILKIGPGGAPIES